MMYDKGIVRYEYRPMVVRLSSLNVLVTCSVLGRDKNPAKTQKLKNKNIVLARANHKPR